MAREGILSNLQGGTSPRGWMGRTHFPAASEQGLVGSCPIFAFARRINSNKTFNAPSLIFYLKDLIKFKLF